MKTPGRKAIEAEMEALREEFAPHRTLLVSYMARTREHEDAVARWEQKLDAHGATVAGWDAQFVAIKASRHKLDQAVRELEGHVETCRQAAAVAGLANEKLDALDAVLNECVAARDTVLALSTDSRLVALLAEREQ